MSTLARHLNFCRSVHIKLELAKPGLYHLTSLSALGQPSFRLQHSKGTSPKASLQVVKPLRVTSLPRASRKGTSKQHPSRFKDGIIQATEKPSLDHFEDETFEDKLASKVDRYSTKMDAYQADAEFTRSVVREWQAVKRHTIRQKHFRPTPFPELLTWAAKEQIMFLHEYDPEEWTISALSEHYPVSEQSLKKLLKSRRQLYQEEDILRHDTRILRNWCKLHAEIESGEMTDQQVEQLLHYFFDSERVCLVANAVRRPDLPHPSMRKRPRRRGPFSTIVGDCLDLQEREAKLLSEDKIPRVAQELSSKLDETSTLLYELLESVRSRQDSDFKIARTDRPLTRQTKDNAYILNMRASHMSKNRLYKTESDKSINVRSGSSNSTYISGKDVYDESGEFLYRIP